jgi:4-amino-4-deoxy-L-arabinose transferase-like glycosyltransferase
VSLESATTRPFDPLENWLQAHSDLTAAVILLVGFLVRVRAAYGVFLDPDEALHFFEANKNSLLQAYKASLIISHPPLLVLVLHYWRILGTSEIALRFPSIIAGTLFCWVAFKWLTILFGRTTGWIGLIFLTFLPPVIALSTEVRQYALLLVFATSAAYLLERALAENSAKLMALSLLCLYLAMLSHYSAFLFAAALGCYAILRMATQGVPTNVIVTWVTGQIFGLGIGIFLYFTHLRKLGERYGGAQATRGWMGGAYLHNSYFDPGHTNLMLFILARTGGVFQYVFGQLVIGDLAYPLFIVGIVFLMKRKIAPGKLGVDSQVLGVFLLLPFALNCAVALAGRYPYGGTRHSSFLLLFAVAGVGVFLAKVTGERMGRGIVVAILVVAACNAFATHHQPYMFPADQSIAQMDGTMRFMRQNIAPTDAIFVDNQTSILLGHYLCQQKPFEFDRSVPGFRSFECGGYRIVATGGEDFRFTAESFLRRWNEMIPKYDFKAGQPVWIIQAGWNIDLTQELQKIPEFHDLKPQSFGKNISIFKLTVGQPMPQQIAPATSF